MESTVELIPNCQLETNMDDRSAFRAHALTRRAQEDHSLRCREYPCPCSEAIEQNSRYAETETRGA